MDLIIIIIPSKSVRDDKTGQIGRSLCGTKKEKGPDVWQESTYNLLYLLYFSKSRKNGEKNYSHRCMASGSYCRARMCARHPTRNPQHIKLFGLLGFKCKTVILDNFAGSGATHHQQGGGKEWTNGRKATPHISFFRWRRSLSLICISSPRPPLS